MPLIYYFSFFQVLKSFLFYKPALNHFDALSGRNNKIYEYLTAGLAIIGSNFESWNNFILGNKIGITVNPCNISEISKAMKFLTDNPKKLQIMEENAQEKSNNYSWKLESQKLLDLYKNLCN